MENPFGENDKTVVETTPEFASSVPVSQTASNGADDKKEFVKIDIDFKISGDAATIDLWDPDVDIVPLEINPNSYLTDQKFITFALGHQSQELSDAEKAGLANILKLFKDQGYKLRIVCNYAQALIPEIKEIFGDTDVEYLTLWKTYCKSDKDFAEHTTMSPLATRPIMAAAYYTKNFETKPAAVKHVISGVMQMLVGTMVNRPVNYCLVYDPYLPVKGPDGKFGKMDYEKSRQSSNFIWGCKDLDIPLVNLSDKTQYDNILKVITPQKEPATT